MKFEYDDVKGGYKGMAAFIDDAGDLCVRGSNDEGVYLTADDGTTYTEVQFEDCAKCHGVSKAFYPGDKITITF